MTPIEIRDALARGMNFDAVMARHASDIQRDQGIDMGLSMARARTDVQNIQNQTDEGIAPAPFASPTAPTIGAQSRALDPLMKALTFNPPTAATAPLRTGTPLGSMGIQGQAVPIDYQQDALMDITPPRIGTPNLRDIDIQARAGLPPLAGMQQARLASDALMDMPSPTQQYRLGAAGLESQNILAQLQAEPALLKAFEEFANRPVSEIKAFQSPSTVTEAELMNLKQISDQAYASLPDISKQRADRFRQQQLMDMPSPTIGTPNLTDLSTQARAALMNDPRVLAANALAQPSPALDPNEAARFARAAQQPTAGIDPNELARFTRTTGQPVSDFSDFEGIASPSFAEQAAQQTAGITTQEGIGLGSPSLPRDINATEVGRFARRALDASRNVTADEAGRSAIRAMDASLAGTTAQEGMGLGSPDLPKDPQPVAGISMFGSNMIPTGLDEFGNVTYGMDIDSNIAGQPNPIFSKIKNLFSDKTTEEQDLIARASQDAMNRGEYQKFSKALNDTTNEEFNLEQLKIRAAQTNNPADIAKVTNQENKVKESNQKLKTELNNSGVTEMFDERMVDRVTPFSAQIQSDMTTPTPLPATPPVGTPPMGTSVIGGGAAAPTTGTYTGTGGLMGLTPSAQLTGLGELGGVLGGRAQYVQQALDPSQQLARYSSFLPTTALTPEMEDYMQRIALPQMEAAFYAQGGDLEGSPFAPTAGSPYSAFENFMRTGQRLDPTQFREYLGEVSGALQASDPTQRQQFLSSMYASPLEQQQLLYQQMAAGTSAATRGALGRMLGRQYQQQQFQDPASAFLPSALARGGIGGAFSQYVTPQGTVAAAGQPPAMSTIMANQGMPPAIPAIPATAGMSSGEMFSERMTDRVTPFSAQIQADMAATPPAVPMATTPAIAPTPVVPQSVQSTMPKVNRPQGMSVAFGGQGGGLYDPTTYNMNPNEFASYLDTQREGLTPRYDITGTNIIGYDALGKGQAIRTEIDKQGNQQNMIVNDPNLISGTTKKKKKKKKKDDETTVTIPPMTMPALVSQGELLQ